MRREDALRNDRKPANIAELNIRIGDGMVRFSNSAAILAAGILGLAAMTGSALAQDQIALEGNMTLQVVTYDDPAAPFVQTDAYRSAIFDGVEFNAAEAGGGWIELVPVSIDIMDRSIRFSYPAIEAGSVFDFAAAEFNGYELSFTPCVGFKDIWIGETANIEFDASRISVEDGRMAVNVEGLFAANDTAFTVNFETQACGGS